MQFTAINPTGTRPAPEPGRCMTCGKPVDKPWRLYQQDGTLRFGCVDSAHDGHADAWHARQDASAIRLAAAGRLAR